MWGHITEGALLEAPAGLARFQFGLERSEEAVAFQVEKRNPYSSGVAVLYIS